MMNRFIIGRGRDTCVCAVSVSAGYGTVSTLPLRVISVTKLSVLYTRTRVRPSVYNPPN